jgi:alpha-L-fucosidase 2
MYVGRSVSEPETPFQIDANFGFPGAVMAMLARDLDQPFSSVNSTQTVVLGPAIPSAWAPGSVEGLRLRGGGVVSFSWDADGVIGGVKTTGGNRVVRFVDVAGNEL